MRRTRVSVVIPTFHREQQVVAAVRSALAQRDVDVEVIVVDDSAERSARCAVEAIDDERVRYIGSDHANRGPARPRNWGLAVARGDFVHFLDDDDELAPGALAALVHALDLAPRAGVAIGLVTPVTADATALRHERAYFAAAARWLVAVRGRFALIAALLFRPAMLVNSACLLRRRAALAVGGYAEDVRLCEDAEFVARVVRDSGYVVVPTPVVRYFVGATSLIHSATKASVAESYRQIRERYRERYGVIELWTLRLVAALGAPGAPHAVGGGNEGE